MVTGSGLGVGGADAVSTIDVLLRDGPSLLVVLENEGLQVCGAGEQMQGALFRGAKESGIRRERFEGPDRGARRAGPQVLGFMGRTLGVQPRRAGPPVHNVSGKRF